MGSNLPIFHVLRICANILAPKKSSNVKCKHKKDFRKTFKQKREPKILVKLTPGVDWVTLHRALKFDNCMFPEM